MSDAYNNVTVWKDYVYEYRDVWRSTRMPTLAEHFLEMVRRSAELDSIADSILDDAVDSLLG